MQGPTEECSKKESLTEEERAELVKFHNDLRRRCDGLALIEI